MLSSVWRRMSNLKGYNDGHIINMHQWKNAPFNSRANNLTAMFQTRLWFVNNNPYRHHSLKKTNELAHLHK